MLSNHEVAAAYRRALAKVHPRVSWSTHFVDRLVNRIVPEKIVLPILFRTLRNHLLEIIFDSVRQDFSTKIQCGDYVVTAKYVGENQTLLITTIFASDLGRNYDKIS